MSVSSPTQRLGALSGYEASCYWPMYLERPEHKEAKAVAVDVAKRAAHLIDRRAAISKIADATLHRVILGIYEEAFGVACLLSERLCSS